jgi:hypothetical protein
MCTADDSGANASEKEASVHEKTLATETDSLQLAKAAEAKRKTDSIAAIKKEKAEKLLAGFRKETDEFSGTTFYQEKRTPVYANRDFIYPYIGSQEGRYWLRLKFQYADDSWLFINTIKIKTDNNQYTIHANFERDNNTEIWEWHDMSPSAQDIAMLRDISSSKKTMVRYVGSQYHDDRNITSREKDIIKKTLFVYDNLKTN